MVEFKIERSEKFDFDHDKSQEAALFDRRKIISHDDADILQRKTHLPSSIFLFLLILVSVFLIWHRFRY